MFVNVSATYHRKVGTFEYPVEIYWMVQQGGKHVEDIVRMQLC